MHRSLRTAECLVEVSVDFGTPIIARHVAQQSRKLAERWLVAIIAVLRDAVVDPCPQLLNSPAVSGHADDRYLQAAALHHGVQRRKDLLVGEVAGGPEEYQRIRLLLLHSLSPHVYQYCPHRGTASAAGSAPC
jgi:hypothetical protein